MRLPVLFIQLKVAEGNLIYGFFLPFLYFSLLFRDSSLTIFPIQRIFTIGKPILSSIPFPFTGEVFHSTNLSLFYDFEEVAVNLMEIDF